MFAIVSCVLAIYGYPDMRYAQNRYLWILALLLCLLCLIFLFSVQAMCPAAFAAFVCVFVLLRHVQWQQGRVTRGMHEQRCLKLSH
jgi:uncharacterized protein involved in response to NO